MLCDGQQLGILCGCPSERFGGLPSGFYFHHSTSQSRDLLEVSQNPDQISEDEPVLLAPDLFRYLLLTNQVSPHRSPMRLTSPQGRNRNVRSEKCPKERGIIVSGQTPKVYILQTTFQPVFFVTNDKGWVFVLLPVCKDFSEKGIIFIKLFHLQISAS